VLPRTVAATGCETWPTVTPYFLMVVFLVSASSFFFTIYVFSAVRFVSLFSPTLFPSTFLHRRPFVDVHLFRFIFHLAVLPVARVI
jgi:hypothetical protein